MPALLDDLPPIREVLRTYDLIALKKFGQHFLLDLNLTDRIARLATPCKTIVEVGPGPGGLTRSLLQAETEKVICIEKDKRFLPALTEIRTVSNRRLKIVMADALHTDLSRFKNSEPIRICANLPYNVGTKLVLDWLLAFPPFWDRMVLMLQKEVAERIVAGLGEKAYGRVSILTQSVAETYIAFGVPARAFTPPPKVDGAVVILNLLPKAQRFDNLERLGQITAVAFAGRRKMLRKSLRPLARKWNIDVQNWLNYAGIDPDQRPETVSVSKFHRLAEPLKSVS